MNYHCVLHLKIEFMKKFKEQNTEKQGFESAW